MHKEHTLTEGPIVKGLLLFALPVFLGNLFQQFYNAFDSWCVGNFIGDNALAAVSSSASLIFLMVGFFNGLAMGAGVILARHYGAKDYAALKQVMHTVVAFGLIVGVFLTVFGIVLTPIILRWMGTPENVLPESISYFRYYFLGAIFTVMYNIFVGILHAVGDSKHPLYYLIISTFVNVVLDLLFVAVFGWGVWSAAVATTVSQGVSAVLCAIRLMRADENYRLDIKKIRIHWPSLRVVIRFGLPSGIQNSVISLANVFVQSNINSFGENAMAGCGSYSRLEGFAFLPVTCFAQGLSTFVGQNLGAEQYGRVKKGIVFGIICSCTMAACVGLISYIFAPQLIDFFADSQEAVDYGVRHMRTICLFNALLALSHCIAAVMRGAGRPLVPMVVMFACWCVLRVSYIAIALRFVYQLETVSFAYPITWTCSSIIFCLYLWKGNWMYAFKKQKLA